MSLSQPGILNAIAPAARYLTLTLVPGAPAREVLDLRAVAGGA